MNLDLSATDTWHFHLGATALASATPSSRSTCRWKEPRAPVGGRHRGMKFDNERGRTVKLNGLETHTSQLESVP